MNIATSEYTNKVVKGIKMKLSEVELPSNRNFGFFCTFVFAVIAAYFYCFANMSLAYALSLVAAIFLVLTFVKSDALLPLNKLWMWFGILLGMIVSPILIGVIFFGIFTPIATFMRFSGRDELRLNFSQKTSYWVTRHKPIKSESFKLQF